MSDTTLQASVADRTLKFRHQRSVNDTLQCFDSWILVKMLGSRDKAEFVSQEAYDRSYIRRIIRIYANKTHGDVISEHAWRAIAALQWLSIALLFYLPPQLTTAIQMSSSIPHLSVMQREERMNVSL